MRAWPALEVPASQAAAFLRIATADSEQQARSRLHPLPQRGRRGLCCSGQPGTARQAWPVLAARQAWPVLLWATWHTRCSHLAHEVQPPGTRGAATWHTWHTTCRPRAALGNLAHEVQPPGTRGAATWHTWHTRCRPRAALGNLAHEVQPATAQVHIAAWAALEHSNGAIEVESTAPHAASKVRPFEGRRARSSGPPPP